MNGKLPVFTIVRETYVHVANNIGSFLLLLTAITATITFTFFISPRLMMLVASMRGGATPLVQTLMIATVYLPFVAAPIIGILGAIAWHRFVILKEPLSENRIPRGRETLSYALRVVAIYAPCVILFWLIARFAIASGMVREAGYLFWFAYVIGYLVLGRFVIAFPAAAVRDRSIGLLDAVRKTKGNTFRLLFAWIACAVPVTFLGRLIDPAVFVGATHYLALYALNISLMFASVLFTTTFASLAYGHFARTN